MTPETTEPTAPTAPGAPADEQQDLREQARKRLQKRRNFTAHLVTYVVVNAMLIGLWAISGAGYFWPAWVLLGWGVGLVLNAWDVFFRRPVTDADVEREIERQRNRPVR